MHTETFLHCPICARQQPVEVPPCIDGHGAECPERVCTVCGTALLAGSVIGCDLGDRPVRRAA